MRDSFGSAVSLTIFGESHGPAVGGVLHGLAAGLPVENGGAEAGAKSWPGCFAGMRQVGVEEEADA